MFTFISPNITYASNKDEDIGGKLFNPIFKLLAGCGDLIIKGLQLIFLGDGDIRIENPRRPCK